VSKLEATMNVLLQDLHGTIHYWSMYWNKLTIIQMALLILSLRCRFY